MKQRIIVLFTALVLCIGARAATVQIINGLRYIIYTNQNYAEVTSSNNDDNYTQSEINIPASITWNGKKYPVTSLGSSCFDGCSSLTSVNIPSSVTSLGENCFRNCKKLAAITIPSSVTSLGKSCFYNCSSLTSVNIPSSVTSLGYECFRGCSSLTSVNIQSPSIKLGEKCFAYTGVDEFTIMAPIPPSISSDCFKNYIIDKAQLMVPNGSVDSYKTAYGWKDFGYILPIKGGGQPGKCETPRISYASGKLQFDSSTPGGEYHYTIRVSDACTDALTKGNVSLAACYDISCYATADGYTVSKTSTAKLYWINANMATDGIAPATQMRGVVVSTESGIVTLSGLHENERVTFYSVSGIKLGETRALNGQASISAPDDVIIARIGTQAVKVKR